MHVGGIGDTLKCGAGGDDGVRDVLSYRFGGVSSVHICTLAGQNCPHKLARDIFDLSGSGFAVQLGSVNAADTSKALAATVRAERAARDLTQKELGRLAGIDERMIRRIEGEETDVKVPVFVKLASGFGLTSSQLMDLVTARIPVSDVPDNVTAFPPLDLDDTGAIDAYQGDKAAYRDPEADVDEQ
jgi:transcriptional regulator with XRE-family HTH domain